MKTSFLSILKTGLLAGLIAAVVNIVLFYIFKAAGVFTDDIFIQPPVDGKPGMPLGLIPVIFSSLMPSIVASILLYFLVKGSKNGFKIFTIITIVLSIIFFANPFLGIKNVPMGYAIALDIMHIPVAAALWYFHKKNLANAATA